MKHARAVPAAALLAVFLLASCSTETSDSTSDELRVAPLTDTNDDPDVVEVELVASKGEQRYLADGDANIWGYRDGAVEGSKASVPGPTLDLKVGQHVIVHFRNELPEATTIHWHGIRLPNPSDGTPSVQVEVREDGEFVYEFTAADAGTFWYHPHVRADEQIERGLYGAVVVRGATKVDVDADRTFVLDDVKLEADGKLSEDTTQLDVMLGRQGNVILANGIRDGQIVARSGARERWRFVNAANGRFFNLRLPKHAFLVIGWDGGLLAEPYSTKTLLIAPGERYEVIVELPDDSGSELALETIHYERGHDVPDPGPKPVLRVAIEGAADPVKALPANWADPIALEVPSDTPEQLIKLSEREGMGQDFPEFFLNDRAFPDVPMIEATSGEVAIWRVENDAEMDHPFHIHGLFFRVLDVNGEAPEHDGWKDTVNVPQKQAVRLAVPYDEPGTWMYHCHILEHAERGMMAELKIEP